MTAPQGRPFPDPIPDQVAAIATKHGKQHQFDEPFRRHLGWSLTLAGIDTDTFGTFTPETPRTLDAAATVEAKARAGMNETGLDIGLANEGSFGPHPQAPMLAIAVELAVCVDDRHGLVIGEAHTTADTNFAHAHVRSPGELPDRFLEGVRFPSHGLVVHPRHGRVAPTKGIHDLDQLIRAIEAAASASDDEHATVQTDMRAHHNPTRQRAISIVAERLALRIATPCPSCATPGFGVCEIVDGLACQWCGQPTELPAARISGCYRCDHRERDSVAEFADPGQCPRCNP
jgi:hypothetical protein